MSKKYLLYIHDDRFQLEKNKSELVNELLTLHYGGGIVNYGAKTDTSKMIIKTPADVPKVLAKVGPSTRPAIVDKTQEDGKNNSESQFKTCKEGHPLDHRGKCFGKGCKYAKQLSAR